jgi:hypothetical protein
VDINMNLSAELEDERRLCAQPKASLTEVESCVGANTRLMCALVV